MRACPKIIPSLSSDCVICGDASEVLKEITSQSIDLIITDPPYFLPARHYETRRYFKRNFADLGILEGFFKAIFSEIERILKPTGTFYIFCDGQSYPLFYYYSYFIAKSVRPLIWDKLTSINGYTWRHQHELILFAEMPKAKVRTTGDGDILRCRAVPIDQRMHPAQKPLELIKILILKSSEENDIILDMFSGSGTTLLAAKEVKRRFIGIELNEDYVKIANQRLSESSSQSRLLE